MSLTYTLRRWIDPDFESSSEKAQTERVLEHAAAQVPGDFEDVKIFHLVLGPKGLRECRLCHWRGEGDRFCLRCLADTLE